MNVLYIPVGIPGCGKSGWANGLPDEVNIESTDSIRSKMGDVNDQDKNQEVFETFYQWIEAGLRDQESVYADATNLESASRSILREIAERHHAHTHLILFRNLGQAISRNLRRERVVPANVMIRMIEKYERAVRDIGYEEYNYGTEVSAVR